MKSVRSDFRGGLFLFFIAISVFLVFLVFLETQFFPNFAPFDLTVNVGGDEPPPVNGGGGGGGGGWGGGGGGITLVRDFYLDKEEIKVSLNQGEVRRESFVVENIGDIKLNLQTSSSLGEFLRISKEDFSLEKGESIQILLDFIVLEDTRPDIYVGEVVVSGIGLEKIILVSLEVGTGGVLFDVRARIPEEYLEVNLGEELRVEMTLINVGGDPIDLNVEYSIRDFEDNIVLEDQEIVYVDGENKYIKIFDLPADIYLGNYVFYVRAGVDGGIGSSSVNFEVVGERVNFLWAIAAALIAILLLIFYLYFKKRKKRKKFR